MNIYKIDNVTKVWVSYQVNEGFDIQWLETKLVLVNMLIFLKLKIILIYLSNSVGGFR